MKNIIISPLFENYFSGRIWMGLNMEKMENDFRNHPYIKSVKIIPFENLIENLSEIEFNSALFYSSIYNDNYLQYIKDVITYIEQVRPDIILLPNKEQLLSFENKGFQELVKLKYNIQKVFGKYYGDIDDLQKDENRLPFPFVLKKNKGALSSGVFLINSQNELDDFKRKERVLTFTEKIKKKINHRNSFKRDNNLNPDNENLQKNWESFFSKRTPIVTQKFVDGLSCDYKVLIFGNKYYALKRRTRDGDFRASGSGKIEYISPPIEVLNFAMEVYQKLNVAFISLDIGIDENQQCYLFEYQGTAFGPLTLVQSKKYLTHENSIWKEIEAKSNLESEYVNAIIYHLSK